MAEQTNLMEIILPMGQRTNTPPCTGWMRNEWLSDRRRHGRADLRTLGGHQRRRLAQRSSYGREPQITDAVLVLITT